ILLILSSLVSTFANPEENLNSKDDLFEGDMRFTNYQKAAARGLIRSTIKTKKWTGAVVPYTIHSSLANEQWAVNAIKGGIAEWEQKTCLRFKQRSNERSYLEFFLGSGCWSWVGMNGGKQQVSLGRGCWYTGVAAHEIGHALGFYHEQSRPDRDQYVKIFWENISSGHAHNFNKYGTNFVTTFGTPYDYNSVMHYSRRAFSKNGQNTIVALSDPNIALGQRRGLSKIDAEEMSLRYGCAGATQGPQLTTLTPTAPSTAPPTAPPTPPPTDCKDSEWYADQCPTLAQYPGYCQHHHEWTKKYCAKSCDWC
ncbi:unnamed protein product, partial [Porites lobata]